MTILLSTTSFLILCLIHLVRANNDRPIIEARNGDLIFKSAYNKNIILNPNGPQSTILVGDVDILQARNLQYKSIQTETSKHDKGNDINNNINVRLDQLESKIESHNPNALFNISLLSTKINRLRNRINALERRLTADNCRNNPCANGGTCLSLTNGRFCLCTNGWEGENCDVDVNECRNFVGSELGCQNGATCINMPGTYECLCRLGWYGIHCTRKSQDCFSGDFEMCGHGSCIVVTTGVGIKCICDQGWTHNDTSIACLTDINECENSQGSRCSVNPKVDCINLPGSFKCGSCPAGYEGDGFSCSDIDECLTLNGGCSTSPVVPCYNTLGSRICGQCPYGYIGDGVTCTWQGSCAENRGGCHPSAQCIETPGTNGQNRQCLCPVGLSGDGIGINGCVFSSDNNQTCAANPCGSHGRCITLKNSYTCVCYRGYGGSHCDLPKDYCSRNPCLNGGSCSIDRSRASGFRCECTAQYSGDLCQLRSKLCGGVLDAEEGNVVYPRENNTNYNHNEQCAWIIQTSSDKVINITFSKFDIEVSPDCSYDFLQIHDGRNSASHLIGRFCGNTFPKGGNIISTHNKLYLWFRTDQTIARQGFTLHWNSITPLCGGEVNASIYGHISSPGFPGKYPPNRDCYWHLFAMPGKRIQLHFFELDLESSPNCTHDYLAIYDGTTASDPLLNKFCNISQPAPITSIGSELLLHFHSDSTMSGNGFQISYISVAGHPGCGGYFSSETGELLSPSMNGKYLNNLYCEYEIKISPDTKIQLNIISFRLEPSFTCQYDYLKIYDGPSASAPLVGTFCGNTYPNSYTSTSNSLFLIFKSDVSVSSLGFKISYEAICHKNITGDTNFVTSPGYPQRYPNNKVCEYFINTVPGKAIQLTFQDFDLEGQACIYDYVEIRDGYDSYSPLLGKFCGTSIPPVQISTHNFMYLKLYFDSSVSQGGFYANYTTFDIACGGIYRETTGLINHPPDNSESYKSNQKCTWLLIAPPGHHIKVTWNRFELEDCQKCECDYVELIEIDERNARASIGKFCGQKTTTPALTTNTNKLNITFVPDEKFSNRGFSLSYTFLNDKSHCGGMYVKESGSIVSPGWPRYYEPDLDCTWIINVPIGQQVKLNVSQFQIEDAINNKCDFGDYLEIRNGNHENSALIGRFCGKNIPKSITSVGNSIHLLFHSDSYISGTGFRIEWDGTLRGCGGTLSSSLGTITSPNFPQNYNDNADCAYKIITSHGSQVNIVFSVLDLEVTRNCKDDYIEFFDGRDSSAPSFGRFCQMNENSVSIRSSSNYLYIKFRSDTLNTGRGFSLNYFTICQNITLSGSYGIIESPDYPNLPQRNTNCNWYITVPKGNFINITITDINISNQFKRFGFIPSSFCENNYLEFIGANDTSKKCILSQVNAISSIDNTMHVRFVTKLLHRPGRGFRLEWVKYGCGGHIQKPSGMINFDKKLASLEIECDWLIETPVGTSVSIAVLDIFMVETLNCTDDYIEIYGGQNDKFPVITKMCNKGTSSIRSSSNFMLVKFVKRSSLRDVYFTISFDSPPATCGGKIISRTGVIHSLNYPKNYLNNLDCVWFLSVPENHKLELNIVALDLYSTESSTSDCGDQIRIYESSTIYNSNYSQLICPNSEFSKYISKSNYLTIQFITDTSGTAKGFKANFTAVCGGKIYTNTEGILKSEDYTTHMNCSWTIVSKDFSQKIALTLTYMSIDIDRDINTTRHCPSSFLKVLDGDDSEAPLIGEYCGRKIPPMLVSAGNSITLVLGSYVGVSSGKFSAHYSTLEMACGGRLISEEGSIASPNYPRSYPKNIDCEWILNASPGNMIYVTFEQFDIVDSDGCNQDYLEIRDSNGIGPMFGVYCGNNIPTNTTVAKTLYIKFHSGSSDPKQGFIFHYGYLKDIEVNSSDSGRISSPLYPRSYDGAGEYSWRIFTKGSQTLSISINLLEIPTHLETCQNELSIYDGYDQDAPLIKQLCELKKSDIDDIQTSSNAAFIKFKLSASNRGARFLLTWRKTEKKLSEDDILTCGSNVTELLHVGKLVALKSPHYPNNYDDNLNCEWIFQSIPGQHLEIKFQDISLEETSNCFADYISLYSGKTGINDWTTLMQKKCDSSILQNSYVASTFLKVKFVTDFSYANRGFLATVYSRCGGVVSDSSGVISPTWFDWHSNIFDLKCDWTIKVRPGRTMILNFEHLNISNSQESNCNNYVILRNGESAESPLLSSGKYCGYTHENKSDIVSSTNAVFISYIFRSLIFANFRLRFEEQNIECGSTIKLDSDHTWEIINSPNYPAVPIPYTDCIWKVIGPREENIRVDIIERFDLERDSECLKEFLEVRNGLAFVAPLVGRYCGAKPSTINTYNNNVYIKYSTQIAEPRNGFKANVSIAACGGTIYSNNGEVTSPKYPHFTNLPQGTVCEWHVKGSPDHVFKITLHDFSFPLSQNSFKTNLTISENDALNASTNVIKTYLPEGNIANLDVETITNQFIVKLYVGALQSHPILDMIADYRGFKITFKSTRPACGGTITTPQGYLTTPGYPRATPLRYCHWMITIPDKSRRIKLEIEDSSLNDGQLISIYNDLFYQSLIKSLPDINAPGTQTFESSGYKMAIILIFPSTSSKSHKFKARFTSFEEALCGGYISGKSGVISSPSIDRTYYCEWTYVKSKNEDEFAEFNTLFVTGTLNSSTPSRNRCRYYDASLSIDTKLSQRDYSRKFCEKTNISLRFPIPSLIIKAIQTKLSLMNFHLQYELHSCGGLLTVDENQVNVIKLPNSFNRSLECSWAVTANLNKRTEIKLQGIFKLSCTQEYLKISQGISDQRFLIGDYCIDKFPTEPLLVRISNLFIEYHTETNASNIQLLMRSVNDNPSNNNQCGGELSPFQKTFSSPNYPKSYNPNIECIWILKTDEGNRISLSFIERFVIEDSENCTKDSIIVYDWKENTYNEIGKYCGRTIPPTFNSTSFKIKVILRTNSEINLDGFKAEWRSLCGTTMIATEKEQFLYSPGYPLNYPPVTICEYQIVSNQNQIVLKVLDLELEGPYPSCGYDNLTINNDILCGSKIEGDKRYVADSFHISFNSDRYIQRKGFKISYILRSCGGIVKEPTILSSGEDEEYENDLNCVWTIEAPPNKLVILTFVFIDLENVDACDTDYVAVYDGNYTTADNRLALLCGHINSTTIIKSQTNIVLLQFVTDFALSYKGFKVEITFSYGSDVGCGGTVDIINSLSNFINSPLLNHSVVYEQFLDCHWIVNAALDKVIKIEFTSFHVAPCRDINQTALGINHCDCDFVEIRDGVNPNSFVMDTFCGHTLPPVIISSGNRISLRFSSDGEIQSSGFKATVTSLPSTCGQKEYVVGNTVQSIKTPGYDRGTIARGLHCVYMLRGAEYHSIHIQIKDLDLAPADTQTNDCKKDKLIIQQTPSNHNQSSGKDLILRRGELLFLDSFLSSWYDVANLQHLLFCGANKSIDLFISGNIQLNIITSPDTNSINYRGVSIDVRYADFCGRNYTEPQGRIRVYNTITNFDQRDNCYILINAPENYTISLYFITIIPTYGENNAYLEIFDGNNTQSNSLSRPDVGTEAVFSTGHQLLLFNKISDISEVSFDLLYVTTDKGRGCGGQISNVLGVITSPLYPETYRNIGTCEWEIETSVGTHLQLKFTVFDLGIACNKNYLQIVDRQGKVFATYCSEIPAIYRSQDNYVKIVFHTNRNNGGTGWVAEFIGTA